MNLIGAASSAGAATMIVLSSAPCSSSVSATLHDRRHALADRDVDGDEVRVLVVDDRVDRDRRLAGLAVADDQLALAAADRDHRVDRLEAGLHRLLHRLALDDAGGLELGRAASRSCRCRPCRRAGCRAGRRCGRAAPRRPGSRAGSPVRLTVSPSTIFSQSPNSTAPTLSDSRFSARPVTSWGSSSISNDMQFSRPWTRAMPSATDRTVPTSVSSAPPVVEALDAALEDAGDLVGLDLHVCRGLLRRPWRTCLRSCSRRLRMEASRTSCRRARRGRRGCRGRPSRCSSTCRPVCSLDRARRCARRRPRRARPRS